MNRAQRALGWIAVAAIGLLGCSSDEDERGAGIPTAGAGGGGGGGSGGAGGAGGTGGTGGTSTGGFGGDGGTVVELPPRIHPQDPHRLEWHGSSWYPVGYYPSIAALTADQDDLSHYHRDLMDRQAAYGINYFRNVFTMGQQYADSTVPYERTGPGSAADGRPKYDLTQFKDGHFDYWHDVLSYAQSRNIVVQVCLLDFWHAHEWVTEDNGDLTHEWGLKHDFYQGANNINGIDVAAPEQYVDPSHPVFEVQQELIARVIDRLGTFPNIVWEVANEATVFQGAAGTAWQLELAEYITSYEQSLGRTPHLVIPRDIPNHEQTPGHHQDPPAEIHDELVTRFADDQPLISDNDCCVTPPSAADRRGKAWACLTAGAHLDLFHYPMYQASVLESQDVADGMRFVGLLGRFLEDLEVDLLGMQPSDELVSNGWCYGRAAEGLIVYLPNGGSTSVTDLPVSYTATWFDPRDGTTQAASDGPTFAAPDDADWVLFIH